jgi:molybdopterin-containing oxidoreductase family iron-sulfur binding subunit
VDKKLQHDPDDLLPIGQPRHWRSLEERAETREARQAAHDEFQPGAMDPADPPTTNLSRRTFLTLVGATTALAASVACEKKGRSTVVPYTKRPLEIVPGVANYYASTFPEGRRGYSVLVKTREGRPIHITGNDEHSGLKGKTSPRALADVLRLYDPDRLRAPKVQGRPASWAEAEHTLVAALAAAKRESKPVLLVSGATASPTRQALLADLKATLPALEHLAWEPAIADGAQEGAIAAYGVPVEIRPRLEKAKVILSLGADFLSGDDPEAIQAFTAKRRPSEPVASMNRLWVIEGAMSLTGTNADQRFPVRPSRIAALAFALAKELGPLPTGVSIPSGATLEDLPAEARKALIHDLKSAGREAVVLCGAGLPAEAHAATALLNTMLGSLALELRPTQKLASGKDLDMAIKAMTEGKYAAAILWDVNPAYAYPKAEAWKAAFAKVPTRAWIGLIPDESAAQCDLVLPEHHWLEAWGDHADGTVLTLQQPTIGALYDTKQGEDLILALLKGLGAPKAEDYHGYLQARWQREVQPKGSLASFERFFQAALHDGLVKTDAKPAAPVFKGLGELASRTAATRNQGFELVLQPGTQVLDGRYGNSSWLQELPDPITKTTWGNPLSISVADAQALNLSDGDMAELDVAGTTLRLPVILQPGQAKGTLVLALGYGRTTGGVARGVGVNAFPLIGAETFSHLQSGAKVTKSRGHLELPRTQSHHRMEGRDLVRSFSLAEFAKEAKHHHQEPDPATLYPDQQFPDHKWGMVIDLSACIGCSACSLACQSENNIPSVGPDQVAKGREMHWMRIDRYYEGEIDNPKVVHQPMLCQHCDSAPCENVCPVNATNHSPDGLNQMAYNRCVGTRYCANNCPYKVRRFNFLEFTADKVEPASLVYNPEVTVRPRGVMEKCTFCVQRIQDVKVRAKGEHRPIKDGEVQPACAAACPSHAIVFGDLKDPNSEVAKLVKSKRGYKVLEEVGARPAITYLADLKNPAIEGDAHA